MSEWRQRIADLVSPYDRVSFYSADPGATANLTPVFEEAKKQGKAGAWFVDGWASRHHVFPCRIAADISREMLRGDAKHAVMMGPQVDFEQAYKRLAHFIEHDFATVFLFDHWKDIATLFRPSPDLPPLLPSRFLVPDEAALALQRRTLPAIGLSREEINGRLELFLHPGIERACEEVRKVRQSDLETLRLKYNLRGRSVVMLLDNVDRKGTEKLGFYWENCLDLAVEYLRRYEPRTKMLVKPHPRQSREEIAEYVRKYSGLVDIATVTELPGEPFVALCDEVWGMTTVLLVVARKCNKPIRVFMTDRTEIGKLDSNDHIEPYVMTGIQDFPEMKWSTLKR